LKFIEQHYGRFLASRVDDQLALLATPAVATQVELRKQKTATFGRGLQFSAENPLWNEASPTGFEPPSTGSPISDRSRRKPRRITDKRGLRHVRAPSRNDPQKPATARANRDGLGSPARSLPSSWSRAHVFKRVACMPMFGLSRPTRRRVFPCLSTISSIDRGWFGRDCSSRIVCTAFRPSRSAEPSVSGPSGGTRVSLMQTCIRLRARHSGAFGT